MKINKVLIKIGHGKKFLGLFLRVCSPISSSAYHVCNVMYLLWTQSISGSRRGGGGQGFRYPPLQNHKNIGLLSNTGTDHDKSQSYQARIPSCAIIGTPAKRHLNGVSLAGR